MITRQFQFHTWNYGSPCQLLPLHKCILYCYFNNCLQLVSKQKYNTKPYLPFTPLPYKPQCFGCWCCALHALILLTEKHSSRTHTMHRQIICTVLRGKPVRGKESGASILFFTSAGITKVNIKGLIPVIEVILEQRNENCDSIRNRSSNGCDAVLQLYAG